MKQNWQDEARNVRDLSFDLQNPRLPKKIRDQKNLDIVRDHLLEHEKVGY